MKSKLYFFLLTALMGLSGMNASAQDPYEISTAQDLVDFATKVNGGETTANAVLTADIDMSTLESWTAIGDWNTGAVTSAYCGHFDGQGHTIKGFNFTASHNYYALFGVISDCLIENFIIEGAITINGNYGYAGGVAAYARDKTPTIRNVHSAVNINSSSTASTPRIGGILGGVSAQNSKSIIDRCSYSGTLNANDKGGNYGGIVGYILNNANVSTDITNCLFDGKIQGTVNANSAQYGGIIGYTRKGIVSVENCLSIGTFEYEEGNAMNIGQFIGRLTFDNNTSGCTFANNYYEDMGYNLYGTSSGGAAKGAAPVEVTAEQLASGEVCYLLNESVSGGTNWFQTLNDDSYPFPYNGGVHDPIYANGTFKCDMTPKEGSSVVYGNANKSIIDDHDFVDGFCTVCGALDETWMTANGEGSFEIGTPIQLKWFAAYANQIDHAANAILTADIALTEAWTTPIGGGSGNSTGTTAYTGTFDGQGHSITGFSAEGVGRCGLFGDVTDATVKNFSISGTLNVTGGYGSGVVGWPTNTTIENIHSALVIDVPNSGAHHTGGVVGSARGNNTISGCTFTGSLTVADGSTDNFAGIAGYITNGDKVINCGNFGTITFSASGCAAGGIVGYVNAQQATIQNCLSTGQITFSGEGTPTYGAAVIGRTKGFSADLVKNNFWLEGTAYGTIHNDKDGSEAMETGSVTAEQLASGEVAYKLGEAWSQIIGTDDVPALGTDAPVFYVGEAGYATLYDTTTGYEFNGDVTASVAILTNTWLELTEIGKVPAGTPVILMGTYFNKTAANLPAIDIENDLKGTDVATEADGTMYVLAKPAEKEVGFYKATGTIPAGKAYFQSNASVKAFFFDGDDATGIENLNNQNTLNTPIYNLAGQRMSKMQKGINIVDGKKILK